MVTNIDAVGVKIDADDRGLKQGLQDAEADIRRFARSAESALKLAALAAGAFTVALAGVAAGAGFNALKNVANELEDIGVKAGTLGLLNNELQELSHVARRVDVDQEKLNAGMEKFAVFLGQARLNTGPLASALQTINPELLKQLQAATSVHEAFLLLADGTKNLASEQDQLALAQSAFSRGGTDLVRVLKLGAEGIREYEKEANSLGFVFSDLQIQMGGELSDAIEESAKAFDHQLKKALIEIAPLMLNLINFATQVIAALRGIAAAIRDAFSTSTAEAVKSLSTQADVLNSKLSGLQKNLANPLSGGIQGTIQNQIRATQAELDSVNEQLRIAQQNLVHETSGPMGPFPASGGAGPAIPRNFKEEEKKAAEEARAAKKEEIEAQRLHNAELQKYLDLRKLQMEIEGSLDPIQAKLAERQDELGRALQKGAIDADVYAIAMSRAVAVAANAYADAASSIAKDLGKVFEGNKSVAIATALINTFQAVTNAWANVPWPLNIAAAAAALAAGMTQVANIRKTTKSSSGGGGGSASSASSGSGVTEVPQLLKVQGLNRDEFFSGAQIGPLVQQLLKYQQDGGKVVIDQ